MKLPLLITILASALVASSAAEAEADMSPSRVSIRGAEKVDSERFEKKKRPKKSRGGAKPAKAPKEAKPKEEKAKKLPAGRKFQKCKPRKQDCPTDLDIEFWYVVDEVNEPVLSEE
ncbi:hypothetical protein THAOC_18351 [Thalassiosira oceanica]|uniref:RxLR effector protein n=1 Tax=Thalassiosira oceanica TaxID=159749 RepID=K0SSH5_THAOC|nr:hypothetical protein THAOC_18351 [Thalassiosira oceanica]|eukprot:EJK61202.1 hypothetical protein THAOC_18351 [Thalassiosira oceanica]